jgi:hypothetical protein
LFIPFVFVASVVACGSADEPGGPGGSGAGAPCTDNADCASGSCVSGTCTGTGSGGPGGGVNTTPGPHFPGTGKSWRPLTTGCGPETATQCTGNCENGTRGKTVVIRPPATLCFAGVGDPTPNDPSAVIEQVVESAGGKSYAHIRITFDPSFTDTTYGGGTCCGWGDKGHKFKDLVGSDHTELLLTDGSGADAMSLKIDLISLDPTAACANATLGVGGGEGEVLKGNPAHVLAVATSISRNINGCGYCKNAACAPSGDCTIDSPTTDAQYTPNPGTPNWDYRVVYEIWIDIAAFGGAGFGQAYITYTHSSPAKLGNTIIVEPKPCPPEWDKPYCPPSVTQEGGNCFGGGDGSCPPNQQTYVTSEGASICTPIPYAGYPNHAPCPEGYVLDVASEGQFCIKG